MILSKEQFPVVVQAYEITNNQEFFIAEQAVNSQAEVDTFVTRYAGKLIKARVVTSAESNVSTRTTTTTYRKRSSAGLIVLIVIIILILLIATGFYTGWIQQHLGISL